MTKLRCGTSSWSESGWRGVVYPKGLKAGEWLRHYASVFDTVEADTTWYRVPSPGLCAGWAQKTPSDFLLSAKFPRTVVHAGEGRRPDAGRVLVKEHVEGDVAAFVAALTELGPRRGPVLLQFPYFNRQAFAEPGPFLERLDQFLGTLPPDLDCAVEVRNAAWLGAELNAVLRAHDATLALTDMRGMPHPRQLLERGVEELLTGDRLYVRLIGDRDATESLTDRFDRTVLDREDRLQAWADLLERLLPRVRRALLYANNHFAGFAPATVRRLLEILNERGVAGVGPVRGVASPAVQQDLFQEPEAPEEKER